MFMLLYNDIVVRYMMMLLHKCLCCYINVVVRYMMTLLHNVYDVVARNMLLYVVIFT